MSYKVCREWIEEEYIEATCPHCGQADSYFGGWMEDDVIKCANKKCKRKFKLGKADE